MSDRMTLEEEIESLTEKFRKAAMSDDDVDKALISSIELVEAARQNLEDAQNSKDPSWETLTTAWTAMRQAFIVQCALLKLHGPEVDEEAAAAFRNGTIKTGTIKVQAHGPR